MATVNWYDKAGFEALLENVRLARKEWLYVKDSTEDRQVWMDYGEAKKAYMKFCEDAVYDDRSEAEQPRDTFGLGE